MPHDNYALIPHTHEPAILLLQSAEGWTLPQHDAIDTADINASIKAQLGCDTTVLYCAYDRYKDDEREEQHLVYVLENHSPDFLLPTHGRWMSKTDLDTIDLVVADHGIPESLHHDDLHGRNILIHEEEPIFFDWAESAMTHPFCSLVIVERVFRYVLEFPVETIVYLRDCYLQEWTQFEPIENLRVACDLAQRVGKLCRALTWGRVLAHLSPDERWEYETAFPYWLRVFLGTEE